MSIIKSLNISIFDKKALYKSVNQKNKSATLH